ncbi:piggyBac transposable element-derived protein 4-like [Zophobas morio]|uniref:piggyBac transposable element-derived protein 4-like n=1 Tax=Zophobas morio TaxID=2755281 RepID=UPI0030827D72
MNIEDLNREIENLSDNEIIEPIPSGSESETDISDREELTIDGNLNPEIVMSEDEADESESDIPLAHIKNLLLQPAANKDYSPPTWGTTHKPETPSDFIHSTGPSSFIRSLENISPLKIFQQFITEDFIQHLVFQTNLYAEQEKIATGKNYISTTMIEIKTFLGINLLMGIKRSPSYKDYWSSAPDLNDPFISRLIALKRFSWLLSHLHVNDNSVMPGRSSPNFDKLYKLRPMIDLLSTNFEKHFFPNQHIAADESMIKFKGRSSLKQFMPKKPIKRGYKMWMLADKTGYCLKFDLYTGKTDSQEKSLSSRVIKQLTSHLQGKNHLLYFDNFFNSVPLLEELKKQRIHAVGTVNISRRYLPKLKEDKKINRGEFEWYTSNTSLAAIKWKDKRSVHILSNFHDPENISEVGRQEKNGNITQVPCPEAVIDYNRNMNFVDKFDQLSSYKIDRRSKKWWHRIFFYLLDAAVINAYCIYKSLDVPELSSKDFRRALVNGLLAEQIVASSANKRRSNDTPMARIEVKKCKPFIPPEVRQNSSAHQPERSTRRRCALCSTSAKQVRTDWICSVCKVPLCLSKQKSCFQSYHKSQ